MQDANNIFVVPFCSADPFLCTSVLTEKKCRLLTLDGTSKCLM